MGVKFSINAQVKKLTAAAEGLVSGIATEVAAEIQSVPSMQMLERSIYGIGKYRDLAFTVKDDPGAVTVAFQYRRKGKKQKRPKLKKRIKPSAALKSAIERGVKRALERLAAKTHE